MKAPPNELKMSEYTNSKSGTSSGEMMQSMAVGSGLPRVCVFFSPNRLIHGEMFLERQNSQLEFSFEKTH